MANKYNKKFLFYFLFINITLFMGSCSNSSNNSPDVSNINVNVETVRTEQVLQSIDTTQSVNELNKLLNSADSSFYNVYFNYVLRAPIDRMTEEQKVKFLNGFIGNQGINQLFYEVDSVYQDFQKYEEDFEKAFKYLKYYFPEKNAPKIYTYISEFSIQKFVFEVDSLQDGLAIGLDMFLGEEYPYMKYTGNNPNFSDYLTRRYNQEHLVSSSLVALVDDLLSQEEPGETLLDKMIYNGKKLYILKKFLPETPDRIIIQYTKDQWDWVVNNEQEMWAYFFKEDLFYSTDINKISKLVSPSPHSSGMPPEAPGRTANYLGWQIVKAFMDRQPDTNLQDLINFGSSQKILELSKFKPKRN